MSYVSAQFHRTTGLGNKLFPWARAKIFSKIYNIPMLRSRWVSIRRGALFRGGINYSTAIRKIWLVGNFKVSRDEIVITKKVKFDFQTLELKKLDDIQVIDEKLSYQFKWDACHEFSDLWAHRNHIKECFLNICSDSQKAYIKTFEGLDFIAMNIRTGKDFKKLSSDKVGYYLTELGWFEGVLHQIRAKYGQLPVFIISDGGRRDLAPLLRLRDVTLVKTRTAVADLQILLRARVLLGSGNSSFSAWASFLGGMDTYSSPDTPFLHFNIAPPESSQIVSTLEAL